MVGICIGFSGNRIEIFILAYVIVMFCCWLMYIWFYQFTVACNLYILRIILVLPEYEDVVHWFYQLLALFLCILNLVTQHSFVIGVRHFLLHEV
jgi:hypothetical protein